MILQKSVPGIFEPDEIFEKYTVIKLLGKGGMGAVYLVRHNVLDSLFALKVLFPDIAVKDQQFVERFIREAKLACKIKHPNLIAVHDAGKNNENGMYYIVMDYVAGGSVRDLLKSQGRIPPVRAIRIIEQVAAALNEAYRFKMVHRDIKPDNIMFAADGNVKLADLGIAKSADQDTMLTMEASVFGTPAYMSPEQAMDASKVDCRADIYSLGIVLFEMLTGRRPYKGAGTIEILSQVVKDEDIPDVRTYSPEISGGVARLIQDMTFKALEKRIATPTELLERIKHLDFSGADSGGIAGKSIEKSNERPVTELTMVSADVSSFRPVTELTMVSADVSSSRPVTELTMVSSDVSSSRPVTELTMAAAESAVESVRTGTVMQEMTSSGSADAALPRAENACGVNIADGAGQDGDTEAGLVKTENPPAVEEKFETVEAIAQPEAVESAYTDTVTDKTAFKPDESELITNAEAGMTPAARFKKCIGDRKNILLAAVAGLLLLFIVIGIFIINKSPEPPQVAPLRAEVKVEKEIPAVADKTVIQAEPVQRVEPLPVQSDKMVDGAIIILGRADDKAVQLKSQLVNHSLPAVVFQEAENYASYRRQLQRIVEARPKCVILVPAAHYAEQGMSPANFETLIRDITVLLQQQIVPFIFMLSEENSDNPKIKLFNAAIMELCKLKSFNVAKSPRDVQPIVNVLLQQKN